MATKKMCAWISRHVPTKAQRADLEKSGYSIKIVNPVERIVSAKWAWAQAQNACGCIPALVVVVLPLDLLRDFVQEVGDQTVIVRAPAERNYRDPHQYQWSGVWQRVRGVQVVTELWTPEDTT